MLILESLITIESLSIHPYLNWYVSFLSLRNTDQKTWSSRELIIFSNETSEKNRKKKREISKNRNYIEIDLDLNPNASPPIRVPRLIEFREKSSLRHSPFQNDLGSISRRYRIISPVL